MLRINEEKQVRSIEPCWEVRQPPREGADQGGSGGEKLLFPDCFFSFWIGLYMGCQRKARNLRMRLRSLA